MSALKGAVAVKTREVLEESSTKGLCLVVTFVIPFTI